MSEPLLSGRRLRLDFSKMHKILPVPDLLDTQLRSYYDFLSEDLGVEKNLKRLFETTFPIEDIHGRLTLEFVDYEVGHSKYKPDECRAKGIIYGGSLLMIVRLTVWDIDEKTGKRISPQDVKEQKIYLGEMPLMTEKGSFIINGVERVIVSQLHRSPGPVFKKLALSSTGGRVFYHGQIISDVGSWIEFESDIKDVIYTRIDRKKKFPTTIILKALGFGEEKMFSLFYSSIKVKIDNSAFFVEASNKAQGFKVNADVEKDEEIVILKDEKISSESAEKAKRCGVEWFPVDKEQIVDHYLYKSVLDEKGEVILDCGDMITNSYLDVFESMENVVLELICADYDDYTMRNTLILDREIVGKFKTAVFDNIPEEDVAKIYIHHVLRPGESVTAESAKTFFNMLFFDPKRYDVSLEGRLKLNEIFNIDVPEDIRTLTPDDFVGMLKYLILLKNEVVIPDDRDSLFNRRLGLVGELLYGQMRIGLLRMQKLIKDRMIIRDIAGITPFDLINAKPVTSAIMSFFSTGQLSQFLDQTNILAEISHKRRLSALGPGGLTRERAGFEVRDVHPSHYGRICPVETPEGPNIGLITSMATYARVNRYGFLETPYRRVRGGRVLIELDYLMASREKGHIIAQANAPLNPDGTFKNKYVSARKDDEFVMVKREEVTLMDVSPNQLVGVTGSLIPFLEHDDANRALMGSNMQRQAVPLVTNEAPLVGTGMESVVARYSRSAVIAQRDGEVVRVEADKICIRSKEKENLYNLDDYPIRRFEKTNQNVCFDQCPIVNIGETVKKGQVIADGPTMDKGELALGKNLVVAFVPWYGYNYEDAVIISHQAVDEDVYTSVHIREFDVSVRDIKLGLEEITADIPNISSEVIRNLDENGIVRIGAYVKPGDVLVGKITPKVETYYAPEERLLRAIFGEKASNVADSSLRVPSDAEGVIIDVKILRSRQAEKGDRFKEIEEMNVENINKELQSKLNIVNKLYMDSLKQLIAQNPLEKDVVNTKGKIVEKKGKRISIKKLSFLDVNGLKSLRVSKELRQKSLLIERYYKKTIKDLKESAAEEIKNTGKEDDLPSGVVMAVKVYMAVKRKLMVGDKMAGRHGNKGVVSKILSAEDLPFLEDGTPVDIVLNPLGVPSRMNIGQILEAHLGFICKGLGEKINVLVKQGKKTAIRNFLNDIFEGNKSETKAFIERLSDEELTRFAIDWASGVKASVPVFESATEKELKDLLKRSGIKLSKMKLYDGVTGEAFANPVSVGCMYVMKLNHLVEDKIHARSIGPYSLVTQQPLGGKAQFGGQRFGEMEVWALEGYGAAYTLQEMLTIKSDDIPGRNKAYESATKGRDIILGGVPESFNVLVQELKSLCLDVELLKSVRSVY
ncbi:MAG: DNA-directed RNA polymerase subunit beta [Desulfurellaceae bacterium]|nr:DNA-directed RNA polymerase subunit beta [Desulfurellaceae bacterium]